MDSSYNITWSASDNIGVTNIALYYSTDAGAGVASDDAGNFAADSSDADFTIKDCQAPTVDITSPVGGENWCTESGQTISWSASDNIAVTNIALYYSTDGGAGWITISDTEENDGIYPWTIPSTPSTQCRVKVVAYDEAGNFAADSSDGNFIIKDCQAPIVNITSPVGGESWCIDSSHDILWSATDDLGVTRIALYYSTDAGSNWTPIDEDEPNDGAYTWTLPSAPSNECRVKVIAYDEASNTGEDVSDSNFVIADCQAPTVDITSPVGGESWCISSSHDILWSASDDIGIVNIALHYSTNGGAFWIPIDETEPNDGAYTWTIASAPSTECRVKVIAYDEAGNAAADSSDNNLTIEDCQPPTLSLVAPVGGESWCVGSVHDIIWLALDDVEVTNIALYYSTDGGAVWIPIDEDEHNDAIYTWTVPSTPSTQCRVKVMAYDEAGNVAEDTSDTDFTIQECESPSVSVIAPNGGQSWCTGSTHDILWSASDNVEVTNVALYYSTDGGAVWIPIDEEEPNDGVYPWVVPDAPSLHCRVKVVAYDEASNSGQDASDADFTIRECQPPNVSVIAPNGGESWCTGTSHYITWAATDDDSVTRIALYYSTDGGSGWIAIDEDEPNDGLYPWIIPNTPSTGCRVKVIAFDETGSAGEDTSDGDFAIRDCQAPTVDLTSPVGGESWCIGSSHDITWSATDDDSVTRIALCYSTDGGSNWIPVDEDEPNDGIYPWIIPNTPSAECLVKVEAYDAANNTAGDSTDSNFTIGNCQSPVVSVLDPNGGEDWCIGESYEILWSATDDIAVTNIALYYSTDGGSSWITIDEDEPNDGVYPWTMPNTPSTRCRVKVVAYDDADSSGEDASDNDFTIRDCEPPTVSVIDPNGGEEWCVGSGHDILWSASDNLGPTKIVSLYYSTDGGSSWTPIDENEFNDGVFAWIIPDAPSVQCRVKVKAYDEAGNIGEDMSNGDFTICQTNDVDHGIEDPNAPANFALLQNHPNPFNPGCKIPYRLATPCMVVLEVYNMRGQKVKTLLEEYQTPGHKTVYWDGTDELGRNVPAGVYLYRLSAGDFADSRKMILLK